MYFTRNISVLTAWVFLVGNLAAHGIDFKSLPSGETIIVTHSSEGDLYRLSSSLEWIAVGAKLSGDASEHFCRVDATNNIECKFSEVASGIRNEDRFAYRPIRKTKAATQLTKFASSNDHACLVDIEGSLFCWGRNYAGKLGMGGVATFQPPSGGGDWAITIASPAIPFPAEKVSFESQVKVTDITLNHATTCVLTGELNNNAYCWGRFQDSGLYFDRPTLNLLHSTLPKRIDMTEVKEKKFESITMHPQWLVGKTPGNALYILGGIPSSARTAEQLLRATYLSELPTGYELQSLYAHSSGLCADVVESTTKIRELFCLPLVQQKSPEWIKVPSNPKIKLTLNRSMQMPVTDRRIRTSPKVVSE